MNRNGHLVVCVDNRDYEASLVVRRIYETRPDADALARGLLRVVDESGEDYLFPSQLFEAIELPSHVREKLALTS